MGSRRRRRGIGLRRYTSSEEGHLLGKVINLLVYVTLTGDRGRGFSIASKSTRVLNVWDGGRNRGG